MVRAGTHPVVCFGLKVGVPRSSLGITVCQMGAMGDATTGMYPGALEQSLGVVPSRIMRLGGSVVRRLVKIV